MFERLHSYEIVTLVAGTLLLLMLLFTLAVFIARKRSLKAILGFFSIAVVMIGFPGISKTSFENGKNVLERLTEKVGRNLNDPAAQQQQAEAMGQVERRPISTAETFTVLA